MALIAACVLTPGVYFSINAPAGLLGTTVESATRAVQAWGFSITPAELGDWERSGDEIVREFRFEGFPGAIAFVVELGFAAEKANHHPDLDIRYNRVRVALSTHSEGGITAKDLALAGEIEAVAGH